MPMKPKIENTKNLENKKLKNKEICRSMKKFQAFQKF